MAENSQFNDAKPPPYAPPPYPGPGDPAAQPQYPPPGQGYGWQQPQPPVTEAPVGGAPKSAYPPEYPPQPGYPVAPAPNQYQAGYPAYPGQTAYPAQPGYHPGYPAAPMTTQHTSVTVMAGGPNVILAPQIAPPDYCGLSWFACLFCFWPTGICAILKSNETRHAINRGDMVTANQLSMETRRLANMTIGIGITIIIVTMIIRFAMMAAFN